MAVGEHEPSDRDFERDATLILNGEMYRREVYGDNAEPRRRDIFAPNINGDLPQHATVKWAGNTYEAELSFRTGEGGSSIPVYEFFIQGER